MTWIFVPTYLNELSRREQSTIKKRGRITLVHQLAIASGIFLAQFLSIRQLLGTDDLWFYAVSCPPFFIGLVNSLFLYGFTEKNLVKEHQHTIFNTDLNFPSLKSTSQLKWSLYLALLMNAAQQLSGISVLFYFYSSDLISHELNRLGMSDDVVPYVVLSTGFVYLAATLSSLLFIDRLSRRTHFLNSLTMICINLLLICFVPLTRPISLLWLIASCAVGLEPIPFLCEFFFVYLLIKLKIFNRFLKLGQS